MNAPIPLLSLGPLNWDNCKELLEPWTKFVQSMCVGRVIEIDGWVFVRITTLTSAKEVFKSKFTAVSKWFAINLAFLETRAKIKRKTEKDWDIRWSSNHRAASEANIHYWIHSIWVMMPVTTNVFFYLYYHPRILPSNRGKVIDHRFLNPWMVSLT